jgi:sugar phosphate isomerase/epimerase
MGPTTSRRGFLLGAGALALAPAPGTSAPKDDDIRLGVATYSLRQFRRDLAIRMIRDLKVSYVNIKEFHLPYNDTPKQLAEGRQKFIDAGLEIVAGGVITLQKDDDGDIRRYFEYAKNCGLPVMAIAPSARVMPRVERFVKEYNIKVAIHNHGPKDPHFPTPESALRIVKDMDPRCGLCIDVGHAISNPGLDVVESIRMAGPRLLDMHIKDQSSVAREDDAVPVGQGIVPIPAIFKQLKAMRYAGGVSLEYEAEPDNPIPGMIASFAYMRGVLAALRG